MLKEVESSWCEVCLLFVRRFASSRPWELKLLLLSLDIGLSGYPSCTSTILRNLGNGAMAWDGISMYQPYHPITQAKSNPCYANVMLLFEEGYLLSRRPALPTIESLKKSSADNSGLSTGLLDSVLRLHLPRSKVFLSLHRFCWKHIQYY